MKKINEYHTKDILNLNDPIFSNRVISSYSSFMDLETRGYMMNRATEVRCFLMARKIIKTFWDCVIEDMMQNDTALLISKKPMMLMKISYLSNFKSKKYYYYKITNGKFYKMFFVMGKKFTDSMNTYYFAYPSQIFIKKLMSNIGQGRTWSQIG